MACESVSVQHPVIYKLMHKFHVEKFKDLVETYPVGKGLRSAYFSADKDKSCRFFLNLYPTGFRPVYGGWMSVFLHLNGSEMDVCSMARYCSMRFSLLDKNGKEAYFRAAARSLCTVPSEEENTNWGYRRFCRLEEVSQHLLENGKLTVACWLTVAIPCDSPARPLLGNVEDEVHCQWLESVIRVLEERNMDSWKILVSQNDEKDEPIKEEITVHRGLMAAQSPVFEAMMRTEMVEYQKNLVEIRDVSPETFKMLVQFMYSGKCEEINDGEDDGLWQYLDLLKLADRYCVENLRRICEWRIAERMNPENVLVIMADLCDRISVPSIERIGLGIIFHQWTRVEGTEDWIKLSSQSPHVAMNLLAKAVKFMNSPET